MNPPRDEPTTSAWSPERSEPPRGVGGSIAPVAMGAPSASADLRVPEAAREPVLRRVGLAAAAMAIMAGSALYAARESLEPARTAPAAVAGYGAKLASVTRVRLGADEAYEPAPDAPAGKPPAEPVEQRIDLPTTVIAGVLAAPAAPPAPRPPQPDAAQGSSSSAGGDRFAPASAAVPGASVPSERPRAASEPSAIKVLAAPKDPSDWPGIEPGSAVPGSTSFAVREVPRTELPSTEEQMPPTRLVPDRRNGRHLPWPTR